MTKTKIKIQDNQKLRNILDNEYETATQIQLCQYALLLSSHILGMIHYDNHPMIEEGYLVNQKWQQGQARMHDVRQAALNIHKLARSYEDEIIRTSLRVTGHAIASGHMKEHAMVASDYAIKVINLLYPNDHTQITNERFYQINLLQKIKKEIL